MDDTSKDIIKAGLRTILAAVPGASSFVQAWSEHDTILKNMRTEELIYKLSERLKAVEDEMYKYSEYYKKSGEIPFLMEKLIDIYRIEPKESKRDLFLILFTKIITKESALPFNDKYDLLLILEYLTDFDIELLRIFYPDKNIRVENMLTNKNDVEGLSKLILSLSKLESRALISQTSDNINIRGWAGDPNDWYNRWIFKHYTILRNGKKLVELLT